MSQTSTQKSKGEIKLEEYRAKKIHPDVYLDLAREVMLNYPEFSFCLKCTDFQYDGPGRFEFHDDETKGDETKGDVIDPDTGLKLWHVSYADVAKGIELWYLMIQHGDWKGERPVNFFDEGDWDCVCTDIAIQLFLFGEVIYG